MLGIGGILFCKVRVELIMDEKIKLYYELKDAVEKQTIIVSFKKKDGDMRVMIGTRNMDTVNKVCGKDLLRMLYGFDKRANAENRNIPVVDLAIGEVRTFSIDRMQGYQLLGELNDQTIPLAFEHYGKVTNFVQEQVEKLKSAQSSGEVADGLISKVK